MAEVKNKVKLVKYTDNPENLIADAARMCYADDEKVKSLFKEKIDNIEDGKMISTLAKMRHLSPFEHACYTFNIEGVSRAMTHQLVRHRIASYSQRSQRYVQHANFDFIIPQTVKEAGLEEDYNKMMERIGKMYSDLGNKLNERLGISGESLNQDARYVLPNACETKIVTTMNARQLLTFFEERLCNRAQWEIRSVAHKMLKLVYPTAPNIFSFAGPACYSEGKCHQGKKTCGKLEETVNYFKNLK